MLILISKKLGFVKPQAFPTKTHIVGIIEENPEEF